MRIALVLPKSEWTGPGVVTGNAITAERWRSIFASLGHEVLVLEEYEGEPAELLVALHARKSAPSVERFRVQRPGAAIIVALTGTDLYVDLPNGNDDARRSLAAATHLVVLQPGALDVLDAASRQKTSVIYQSASAQRPPPPAERGDAFLALLVAHVREIKDPFLAARAVAHLPEASRVRVRHVGHAPSGSLRREAIALTERSARYEWLGARTHEETRRLLAASQVLLLTSRAEGGANVLSEALALDVPIVASRAAGIEGLLGPTYPGLFSVGDERELARLLWRAESEPAFHRELSAAGRKLAPLVDPALEAQSWRQLLEHTR